MSACPAHPHCDINNWSTTEVVPRCAAARLNRLSFWPPPAPLPLETNPDFPQVAAVPVFLSAADRERITQAVRDLHELLASPAWAAHGVAQAPSIAHFQPGNTGVLFGFDFHVTPEGPKLIEINTNAGGALISVAVMSAQHRGCGAIGDPLAQAAAAEQSILDSFMDDWHQARDTARPCRIAIVDKDVSSQYLREEFRLFVQLFQRAGMDAVICEPQALEGGAGGLRQAGLPVDMIYNRLTDFYLDDPALAPLREAYLSGAVVVSPHPRAHALFADKRHLARLCDPEFLRSLGLTASQQAAILDVAVPTRIVEREQADILWRERRGLYFKPAGAFGGRGAYEGAKLTRATFERLLNEPYVAQTCVPAPRRQVLVDTVPVELKYDVRCYAYRGDVHRLAARLYRGQTTNFRTKGGGFAAVRVVPN